MGIVSRRVCGNGYVPLLLLNNLFILMEEVLTARLCPSWEHHAAVPFAIDAFGQSGIGESVHGVAQRIGLSQRRFIQVFTSTSRSDPEKAALPGAAVPAGPDACGTDRKTGLGKRGGVLWIL